MMNIKQGGPSYSHPKQDSEHTFSAMIVGWNLFGKDLGHVKLFLFVLTHI